MSGLFLCPNLVPGLSQHDLGHGNCCVCWSCGFFVSSSSLFFANKISIYSIIANKGVICFVSKSGWDKIFVKVRVGRGSGFGDNHEIHEMKTRKTRNKSVTQIAECLMNTGRTGAIKARAMARER